jgi:phosphoribosylformylglycinamidine synthase
MKTGAVVGIQDMGAAGFTCSTSEMGSRGGTGMSVDVSLVPQRETGMIPYEIMLSESQERMLLVVERGRERDVEAVFEKWDLHAVKVGEVTDGTRLKIHERGTLVGDVPNRALTDEAPVYNRPMQEPTWQRDVQRLSLETLGPPPAAQAAFEGLITVPTIASKRWAYRQYDHTVGTNTIAQPGMSAAVVRVKGTARALAISVDGNGRFGYLNPYTGAMLAVAEASRNVACAGGEPIGATNNLNFGNPERPEIMWQIGEAVRGIGDACRALSVPITGGNVSLYNETEGRAIYPTPVLGVVGLLEDASRTTTRSFKREGASIVLLGDNRGELGGTEYLATMHRLVAGQPPAIDLKREAALQSVIVKLIRDGVVESAHDCSEGGLAIAIAECCFDTGGIGAVVRIVNAGLQGPFSVNATLFGESPSRIVVSAPRPRVDAILAAATAAGITAVEIGSTGGDRIQFHVDGRKEIDVTVSAAEQAWATAIEKKMQNAEGKMQKIPRA